MLKVFKLAECRAARKFRWIQLNLNTLYNWALEESFIYVYTLYMFNAKKFKSFTFKLTIDRPEFVRHEPPLLGFQVIGKRHRPHKNRAKLT